MRTAASKVITELSVTLSDNSTATLVVWDTTSTALLTSMRNVSDGNVDCDIEFLLTSVKASGMK